MVATACPGKVCKASAVIGYWRLAWDTHAVKRTVTFARASDTELRLVVTDASGRPAGLAFEAGVPVTLTVVNPAMAGGSTASHSLTAPRLYRAAAWQYASTDDGRYMAPSFDSFLLRFSSGAPHQIELRFVPLIAGTYDAYCEEGVAGGADYAGIAAGTTAPDLATGHAGLGMAAAVTITGELGVAFDPELDPGRDPALDADPRRSAADPVWASAAALTVEAIEVSPMVFDFAPADLSLAAGDAYVVTFRNPLTNLGAHVFRNIDFTARAVLRRTLDTQAEVRAGYLHSVHASPGRELQLHLVPAAAGTYTSYCSLGVRFDAAGNPDLATGHAGRGMVSTVTVSP